MEGRKGEKHDSILTWTTVDKQGKSKKSGRLLSMSFLLPQSQTSIKEVNIVCNAGCGEAQVPPRPLVVIL